MPAPARPSRDFALLFAALLVTAAGNTALQSVLPALGRILKLPDVAIALTFSFSSLVWAAAAPFWARQSERSGRRNMVLLGLVGFAVSSLFAGIALTAAIERWIAPTIAFTAFILGRMLYGATGAAAPPASQALVASRTSRAERTNALAMLASAFGLGTIVGPAMAPFLVIGAIGLAGPAYAFALIGAAMAWAVWRLLPNDAPGLHAGGMPQPEPSIVGQPYGASAIKPLNAQTPAQLPLLDPRITPWLVVGLVMGHAQAAIGQTMGFLIIDRLAMSPMAAQPMIGVVLMAGAGAALLAQWGLIPRLGLNPRQLCIWGTIIAAAGSAAIAVAESVHGLAVAYGIASMGFGFLRPGFTAGASLAVGTREQDVLAGRVTAANGLVFVLGPLFGVLLYAIWRPLPFLVADAALLLLLPYCLTKLGPRRAA